MLIKQHPTNQPFMILAAYQNYTSTNPTTSYCFNSITKSTLLFAAARYNYMK